MELYKIHVVYGKVESRVLASSFEEALKAFKEKYTDMYEIVSIERIGSVLVGE